MNKLFCTLDRSGNEVIRNIELENKNFSIEKYHIGEFDQWNFQWHEMFNNYVFDDNGCDYERMGCFIKQGDVVLDIGANIGIFAHRAELRGAKKVISFEPLNITYKCLIKNKGSKTSCYNMGVGGTSRWEQFQVKYDFLNLGGVNSINIDNDTNNVVYSEISYIIGINELFNSNLTEKIDFMKVDIEGGEVELLTNITDDNLKSLRCLSCEFHAYYDGFDDFQNQFVNRMSNLGFNYFILYHSDGKLRTVSFWK
jgi:FkbM family methyltransferase